MSGPAHAAVAALVVAVAACAGGCGIDGRSDQYRCDPSGACDDGRTCVEGWCVTGSGGGDGGGGSGLQCDDTSCTATCGDNSSCSQGVTCEAGKPCTVTCSGKDSCDQGVDCSAASECHVTCSGRGSCREGVTCGAGRCTIDCAGPVSCLGPVDCGASCACDLTCNSNGACAGSTTCPFSGQCDLGTECTSAGSNCDQC